MTATRARRPLCSGSLVLDTEWELESRFSILEPLGQGLSAPLSGKTGGTSPRSSLVLTKRSAPGVMPEVALEQLLSELAKSLPGFKSVSKDPFQFDDGNVGAGAIIDFETQDAPVRQMHVVRRDGQMLVHMVGTINPMQPKKMSTLQRLARSYQPERP